MSGWNYRVVHRAYPDWGEESYGIYECYYDDDDNPEFLGTAGAFGDTIEEMLKDLEHYRNAVQKPVLQWDEIVSEDES